MHTTKGKDFRELYKVVNSPTFITGILGGHMRQKDYYSDPNFEYKDIFYYLKNIKAKNSTKILTVKGQPSKWEGLNSFGKK